MNINQSTIYIWQLADRITTPIAMLCVFTGIFTVILFIVHAVNVFSVGYYNSKTDKERFVDDLGGAQALVAMTTKWLRGLLFVFTLSFATYFFAPDSKTIAMMVVIPKLADSKVVQKDLPDIYNAAIKALKAAIEPKSEKP